MRNKLRLELQWLGTAYAGWQAQPNQPGPPSIYEVVHAALKQTTGQDGGPVVAGRTDKGVHAMRQLATVTVRGPPPAATEERRLALEGMRETLNGLLPADVRVLGVADAHPSAHALSDSSCKTYSYFVLSGDAAELERCAAWAVGCWLLPPLDLDKMAAAAALMVGHHDFRSFTSTQDPRHDSHRTIHAVNVRPCAHYAFPLLGCYCAASAAAPLRPESCPCCSVAAGGSSSSASAADTGAAPGGEGGSVRLVQLQFVGAGFLKHQVRRLVGMLARVGSGDEPPEAVSLALAHTAEFDRRRAPTAPAHGLWLETVE